MPPYVSVNLTYHFGKSNGKYEIVEQGKRPES
jgi:hypothetical protein